MFHLKILSTKYLKLALNWLHMHIYPKAFNTNDSVVNFSEGKIKVFRRKQDASIRYNSSLTAARSADIRLTTEPIMMWLGNHVDR